MLNESSNKTLEFLMHEFAANHLDRIGTSNELKSV